MLVVNIVIKSVSIIFIAFVKWHHNLTMPYKIYG